MVQLVFDSQKCTYMDLVGCHIASVSGVLSQAFDCVTTRDVSPREFAMKSLWTRTTDLVAK